MNNLQAGVDYCGYCKVSYDENGECSCNGFGHAKGSVGTCGYCGSDYFVAAGTDCSCDGFGGDPVAHEETCRYCTGGVVGGFCTNSWCGKAQ